VSHPRPPPIADYELVRLIGQGSYGDVWLARGVTGVFRAVKIVWRDRFPDTRPYEREFEGVTRFAAISLREPSQLALLHAGRQDGAGFFYYVMELADDVTSGREIDPARYTPCTLQDFSRQRGGRIEIAEVVALGAALARALASLHAAGLVHRDIKPSNVILVGGVPKLADIGLVALASAQLTFVGTEGFVPPEGPGAPSADVYSLGKLLYELATGLDRHDYPRLPPDLDSRPDQRALLELNEILVRACETDARLRFQDASALLDELLLLQAGKSVRRLRRAERRTARALRVATWLAVVAALAGGGALVERRRAGEETSLRLAAEAERDALRRKAAYSAGVERAQAAIAAGSEGRARKLLAGIAPGPDSPDRRGFEWHALWREAQGDPARELRASGPPMRRGRISPDGKWIAGQDDDMRMTLWDAASGAIAREVGNVFRLGDFSADGRWLIGLTTVPSGTARVSRLQRWSVATGEPDGAPMQESGTHRIIAPLGADRVICFADGTEGRPHAIRVWDFARRQEILRLPLPPDADGTAWDFYRPDAVGASLDGKRCAVALLAGRVGTSRWKIEVYDLEAKRVLFSESTAHRIGALALSADGTRLAVVRSDIAEIAMLEVGRGTWRWQRRNRSGPPAVLAFSPSGTHLAAGGAQVDILDAATGETVGARRGNSDGVADVAWLPDGSSLVSTGTGGDLRRWSGLDPLPPAEMGGFWIPAGGGRKLCLSPDGAMLVATDAPAKGPRAVATAIATRVAHGPARLLPVGFLPGGDELVGVMPDGRMERRRVRLDGDWPLLETAQLFDEPVEIGSSAVLSASGAVLVVGGTRGRVVFWDVPARRRIATVDSGNTALGFVAVSPDGRFALTGGSTRSLARLWDVARGQSLATLSTATARPLCGGFSPDGQLLALGWNDGTVEIRRAESGRTVRRIRSHSPLIQQVEFSPDSSSIAAGAPGGNVHLFAVDDGREVITLRVASKTDGGSDTRVSHLAFSADGSVLAAYVNDGRVRLWRR
jgi:WD40 repeat protein